jgi:Flavodoxin domain
MIMRVECTHEHQGVVTMQAVVVYESMYGNTHRVADAIAAGLQDSFEVAVVPVAEAGPAVLADADLVVVGGPTHAHGMSRAATRRAASEAAAKPGSGLTMEPGGVGPGLREWFASLGQYPVRAAAFDTRVHGPSAFTGRAAKGVTRLLRGHGFDVVAKPESFLVTRQNVLDPGETTRARDWAVKLAASIRRAASPTTG